MSEAAILYTVLAIAGLAVLLLIVGTILHVRRPSKRPLSVYTVPIVGPAEPKDTAARIKAAAALRDAGHISDADYEALKIKILFE